MSTKEQKNLEIIKSVESRGGSAAYQKNPELFNDISDLYDEWEKLYKPSQLSTIGVTDLKAEVTEAEKEHHKAVLKKLAEQKPIEASKPSSHDKPKFNPPPFPPKEKIILQTFQGFEALGGSAGYTKHLDSIGKGPSSTKPAKSERLESIQSGDTDWDTAHGWFLDIFGLMSIDVFTRYHSGTGWCWGTKEGATKFYGSFVHRPWDVLLSAVNDMYAIAWDDIVPGVMISFEIDGEPVGNIAGDGSTHMAAEIQGRCKWT